MFTDERRSLVSSFIFLIFSCTLTLLIFSFFFFLFHSGRCNYNLDFQGKALRLFLDNDGIEEEASSEVTIDCANWGRNWLDFPRRGIIMVHGEGEGTVIGPGVAVQNCGTNGWLDASPHSHPGERMMQYNDWSVGGAFLIVGTSDDAAAGPILDGVTVRQCYAHYGAGVYVKNTKLSLRNVTLVQGYGTFGQAM